MANSFIERLNELNAAARASDDEDYKAMNTVNSVPLEDAELEAAEKRARFARPRSYKKFVLEHGAFGVGTDPAYDHMSFRMLEIGEVDALEEDYGASTSEEIADNMGVEESHVEATKRGVAFAMQGHEDYWVFDDRSRDDARGECKVIGVLLADCELEYFAACNTVSERSAASPAVDNQRFESVVEPAPSKLQPATNALRCTDAIERATWLVD